MELDPLPSPINRQEALGSREESILMRHRTELVFEIGPGKEGGLLEGFDGSYRSQDGLEWAVNRGPFGEYPNMHHDAPRVSRG